MISTYVVLSIVAILVVIFAIGFTCYIQSIRIEVVCESSKTDYPKSMIALSESKIIELETRKDKYPLCCFKNGKKIEYKKKGEK